VARARLTAAAITASLLVASCGSSGGGGSSAEDTFLDKVDAICRTAGRVIDNLDPNDDTTVATYVDTLSTATDALDALKPPKSLSDDFEAMTSTFDDELTQATKLRKAVQNSDSDGVDAALTKLTQLQSDATSAADSLNAQKCKNLAPPKGLVVVTTTTEATTTTVAPTEPPTIPPPTEPPVTEPPVTEPPVTVPPGTVPTTDAAGARFPEDLDTQATAPPGFEWVPYEQSDAQGLWAKPDLGPIVDYYAAGRIKNTADGYTASIFVLRTTKDIAGPALDQYLFWEGTSDGTDTKTPEGVAVKQKLLAFDQTDCVTAYGGNAGITVCTFAGIDGLTVLDAFLDAQTG